ncbi:DUF6542 domain-containing protein [Pseudonocardia sp. D17]|uniref:DUF6542 domain-containing protein n=1 Tax=Pseudonocardia sp. D17 TaxID=882661 RepID=UPI0030D56411
MTSPRPAGAVRHPGRPGQGRSGGSGSQGQWPMPDRSIIGTVLGIPPVAALGVAVAFTGLGVLIDVLRSGTAGIVFKVGFFTGCLLAVMWVRRRSLFLPIVQPPLLVAVLVPVMVLLVGPSRSGGGTTETLLLVGAPLINSFPTMATTTAVVVGIGIGRLLLQRNDDPELRLGRLAGRDRAAQGRGGPAGRAPGRREPKPTVAEEARRRAREKRLEADRAGREGGRVSDPRGSGGARGEGRTSRSPRQS